jgi:hypothetical protein
MIGMLSLYLLLSLYLPKTGTRRQSELIELRVRPPEDKTGTE